MTFLGPKKKVLNYKKTHTNQETLARFPEISLSTLKRMKIQEAGIRTAVHSGRAQIKRKRPLAKYAPLGERLNKFFVMVRDAQGAVTRGLGDGNFNSKPRPFTFAATPHNAPSRSKTKGQTSTHPTANGRNPGRKCFERLPNAFHFG